MIRTKTEAVLILKSLDFIHQISDLIRPKYNEARL